MLGLFNFLRRKTAESIFQGVSDAMLAIDNTDDAEVTVSVPEALRLRLMPPADGDKNDKPTAGKKK